MIFRLFPKPRCQKGHKMLAKLAKYAPKNFYSHDCSNILVSIGTPTVAFSAMTCTP